ncbi:hypothetical protein Pmani_016410 [Petrolisthes manimaculis]|uniref:TFIIS central domain-containing protein n=1 Tax=Petrolisthes manimaculis TaxID=1843537 RepID=A0AAE1PRQ9_9EUCA|nr:hypothetical protein Pmani_016410 [Petrolisthes manimaculis]
MLSNALKMSEIPDGVNSKNPQLRENVLRGVIAPKKMANMTSEEMASNEMKALQENFTKVSIDDHQLTVA